jgi:zinc D-Ala-D-Ala carboxypeptidase
MNPTDKLSEHFTYEELTRSDAAARLGVENTPNESEIENLKRLAELLEEVKKAVGGKAVMINSGFRSKPVNDAVGSKDTSQHRLGCAADLRVPGMKPREVVEACIAAQVPFDQIILEFDSWTHISVPNTPQMQARGQKLIIDKQGTRAFS